MKGVHAEQPIEPGGRSARGVKALEASQNDESKFPFLYTYPGFVTEELSPWHEDGEEWRPLKVTFPDYIASHNREQVSYFGENGLLRRHEYAVDILGGARGLNYAADYQNVSGIMVPTKRKVYPTDAMKQKVAEPILVAIDLSHIEFEAD